MSLSVGIVGLPNAGKSTLFNALLNRQLAAVANFPFTTIEPNVGIVPVPDERLDKLADVVASELSPSTGSTRLTTSTLRVSRPPVVPAVVQFIDIAGLVKGAHQGEGLGNQFLAKIREVSLIVHLVRAFTNPDVPHYYQTLDPVRDIEIINIELELGGIKKPVVYVANVSEDQLTGAGWSPKVKVGGQEIKLIPICAKLEADLADFTEEEKRAYLRELDIKESGLDKLIKKAYQALGLITFYTIKGGKEVRAWSLPAGKTALEAAGEVHTDMAQGFIKVEVVSFEDLVQHQGFRGAAEAGKVRLEGKEYVMREGDIVEFKFNV